MLVGTTIALAGTSFVLIFALRSLRIGLTNLVPNLALGFGVWVLMKVEGDSGTTAVSR